jgi:MoaA/NifB/PqqE/SkfB family radical SAM enzyme
MHSGSVLIKFMSTPLCIAPWIGMSVRHDGSVRPCCAFQKEVGNLNENKLSEIFLGEEMESLRQSMLSQKAPSGCEFCFKEESEGRISKRIKVKDHAERKNIHLDFSPLNKDPKHLFHLDLAFSNRCNLTCAMCSSEYSTSWKKFESKYESQTGEKKSLHKRDFLASREQMEEFLAVSKNIQTLQVLGGEPLLEPLFEEYLIRLAEINPNCQISIATNGSHLSEKWIHIFNRFVGGSIDLSIDGTEKTYEYIRGYPFSNLESKLEHLSLLKRKITVYIFFTTSLYNFPNIPKFLFWISEIEKKFKHLKFRPLFEQIVSAPPPLSCKLAPIEIRINVANEIRMVQKTLNISNPSLDHLVEYLMNPTPLNSQYFRISISTAEFYNQIRGFKIWDISPELSFLNISKNSQEEIQKNPQFVNI